MPSRKPLLLVDFSDTHCNSTLGLCPEEGVKLPEGGRYEPSPAQVWLWERWMDAWAWVDALCTTHKASLLVVCSGDAVDGTTHHGQTQFITADEEAMMWLTERCFSIPRDLVRRRRGKFYVLRGTRSHVGSAEQALARWLQAEREPDTDLWARYILKLDLHGVRVDIRHHAQGVGTRPWTRNANALAASIYLEHVTKGWPHPHLAIRSHKHVCVDSYDTHPTRAIVTPAWQLATDYVHKIAPEAIADIGLIAACIQPDGTFAVEKRRYHPDPPPTERPT